MKRTDWIIVGLRLIGAYVCLTGLLMLVAAAGLPKLPDLTINVFRFSIGTGLASALLGGSLALFAARLGEWFERFDRGEVRLSGFGGPTSEMRAAPRSVHAQRSVARPDQGRAPMAANPQAAAESMQDVLPTPERPADEAGVPTWSSAARTSRRRKRGPFERLLTNSTPGRDAIRARRARRRKAADQRRSADAGSDSAE